MKMSDQQIVDKYNHKFVHIKPRGCKKAKLCYVEYTQTTYSHDGIFIRAVNLRVKEIFDSYIIKRRRDLHRIKLLPPHRQVICKLLYENDETIRTRIK